MFHKPQIKPSSQLTLDAAPLQHLLVELDEQNEEALSGGSTVKPLSGDLKAASSAPVALVLLFSNPFSY
ncbi:MAG: hypothetical protein AB1589_36025 [Cyanobacteriota bacterium]